MTNNSKTLAGGKIAGGNPEKSRVENDFYATDPKAVETLLRHYNIRGSEILEPCVANGNIIRGIKNAFHDVRPFHFTAIDIKDRGYQGTIVTDYLQYDTDKRFDCIITNPPYSMAEDFIRHSMELLDKNDGQLIMFLKIQFLEGAKREKLFTEFPPKYIYVFRNRMPTWNNGDPVNPATGKRWATTMCHAWFIWETGSKTEPIIRWL